MSEMMAEIAVGPRCEASYVSLAESDHRSSVVGSVCFCVVFVFSVVFVLLLFLFCALTFA